MGKTVYSVSKLTKVHRERFEKTPNLTQTDSDPTAGDIPDQLF